MSEAIPFGKRQIIDGRLRVYYYGYWVYDDLTDYYYWFPADYVIVDSSWVEYAA